MFKKLLILLLGTLAFMARAQTCPQISYPSDGDINIPVNPTITWPAASGINGYLISVGTSSGGTDIVNGKPLGVTNSYTPPLGFPANTRLFVSISLTPFDGPPIPCEEISFRTVAVNTPPPCTMLIAPDNNAASVTIITDIVWAYAPTAIGYFLSMGTQPNGTDILDRSDVSNTLSYDPPQDLPQNTTIFVKIEPYNNLGTSVSCTEEFFTTSTSVYACDPFVDQVTGALVKRKPDIDFPRIVGICSDELPYTIATDGNANGFRWYLTNSGSTETLISESRNVGITQPGRYRFEAYNLIPTDGGTIECATTRLFEVVASETAIIENIEVLNLADGKTITIFVTGAGQYEYSLDDANGPYQDVPIFTRINYGQHTVFVRDKNGCGTTQRTVDRDLTDDDFPKFFTPNGDGTNDYWQFMPPPENYEDILEVIFIFDRYGKLLKQLRPNEIGWDGTFNGIQVAETDYWYKASFLNGQQISGHFSLIR